MNKNISAVILIILGIIVLAFPILGVLPFSIITGLIVAIVGLGLLFTGVRELSESTSLGILGIILGIIALILGLGFIINPSLFSYVAGLLVWIVGIFLIITGIVTAFTKTSDERWTGFVALIIGIIYVIVGVFISNPIVLGTLIGLWLIISGILILLRRD